MPVKTVRRIVPEIIRYGEPVRAGLGVKLVSDRMARRNGIKGVVIESVGPGSPAEKAGLQGLTIRGNSIMLGDIIVEVDGTEVNSYDDLYNALDTHRPGDTVSVSVRRGETIRSVRLQLIRL